MISVLMSTYREPIAYISLSVDSILKQTYEDIELILVVDDPANKELINYLKSIEAKDTRVKLLINDTNLGLTGSLNRALSIANGEFVARMDADDISDKQRFDLQLSFLENNNLDLVGCNVQDMDEEGNISGKVSIFPRNHSQIVKETKYNSPLAHPTWIGKKEVFDHLNGYQEIDACEDYDFLVRAILSGFKLGNFQEPLLKYRINSSGISSTKKAKQKAALFLIRKNYRSGRSTTEEEYEQYMRSDAGKKKIQDLDKYYKKTSKLKNMSGNKIKKIFYAVTILVSSNEARSLLTNMLREKMEVR